MRRGGGLLITLGLVVVVASHVAAGQPEAHATRPADVLGASHVVEDVAKIAEGLDALARVCGD